MAPPQIVSAPDPPTCPQNEWVGGSGTETLPQMGGSGTETLPQIGSNRVSAHLNLARQEGLFPCRESKYWNCFWLK